MTTIKFRRDTSANWTSANPIPAQGEPCYETDTGKLKIGNGSDNYVTLPYVSDGGGSSGDLPIATATTLGGVKVGNNLSITEDGTLSASSEAKTVKTPSGRIRLDDSGLHNEDNSRSIINRNSDSLEVRVGNDYEPTIIDGNSIKLNSTNITDKNGNTFLSGDTIKGVKFYQNSGTGNKNIANSGHTNNRLELATSACNLYDSDNRQVFGSSYNSGIGKTDWKFASQSNTVRIANESASNAYGLMLQVPTDGTSPTIGYTYYGTDSSLYGKEQTFLRTEDVDNSTIKIVDGKLTASGGGSAPTNMVTTDTDQTIEGVKTFTSRIESNNNINMGGAANVTLKGGALVINQSTTEDTYPSRIFRESNCITIKNGIPNTITSSDFFAIVDRSNNKVLSVNAGSGVTFTNNNGESYRLLTSHELSNFIDTNYLEWNSATEKITIKKDEVAGLAMPSDKYVSLTLGASGTQYTAPASGWFRLVKKTTAVDQNIQFNMQQLYRGIDNSDAWTYQYSNTAVQILTLTAPIFSGNKFWCYYSAGGDTVIFEFVYTVGTAPTNA